MSLKKILSLGIASVGVLTGASAAQSASLQGRVGINPPSPVPGGESTGVVFIGTGVATPDGTPLTGFDFVPPSGGGVGPIVELNANPLDGRNDFAPFVGQTGTIRDASLDQISAISPAAPFEDFILIENAFSVDATSVSFPIYSENEDGTTVSIGVEGIFTNLSDGSSDTSNGVGTLSVDFAGLTIPETQALFDEPGEMPDQFNPGTWSSNWVVAEDIPNVPEASNLLGLLVIGLGGAAALARKK